MGLSRARVCLGVVCRAVTAYVWLCGVCLWRCVMYTVCEWEMCMCVNVYECVFSFVCVYVYVYATNMVIASKHWTHVYPYTHKQTLDTTLLLNAIVNYGL